MRTRLPPLPGGGQWSDVAAVGEQQQQQETRRRRRGVKEAVASIVTPQEESIANPPLLPRARKQRILSPAMQQHLIASYTLTVIWIYALVIPLSLFNLLGVDLPMAWRRAVQVFGGVVSVFLMCRPRGSGEEGAEEEEEGEEEEAGWIGAEGGAKALPVGSARSEIAT
ncbi:hypothetical protein DFJ73DRAFT_831405 [Zopfochytrium polystomum]|nr:hypothetical protein DFJ73DRAFT_831405 [Zopfochytrium polystomum]